MAAPTWGQRTTVFSRALDEILLALLCWIEGDEVKGILDGLHLASVTQALALAMARARLKTRMERLLGLSQCMFSNSLQYLRLQVTLLDYRIEASKKLSKTLLACRQAAQGPAAGVRLCRRQKDFHGLCNTDTLGAYHGSGVWCPVFCVFCAFSIHGRPTLLV